MQNGLQSSQGYAAALSILQGMVAKQAAVMAYSDLFQIAALLAGLGVIAAILIQDIPKVSAGNLGEDDKKSVSVAIH